MTDEPPWLQLLPEAATRGEGFAELLDDLSTAQESRPLTKQMILDAAEALREHSDRQLRESVERWQKMHDAIPPHMRGTDIAGVLLTLAEQGAVLHPRDKEVLRTAWAEALEEMATADQTPLR